MTTPTPNRIAVETIQTQNGRRDVITDVQAVRTYVEQLECERDEARERNVKGLGIVLDLMSERDAWRAKAEASQKLIDALVARSHIIPPKLGIPRWMV